MVCRNRTRGFTPCTYNFGHIKLLLASLRLKLPVKRSRSSASDQMYCRTRRALQQRSRASHKVQAVSKDLEALKSKWGNDTINCISNYRATLLCCHCPWCPCDLFPCHVDIANHVEFGEGKGGLSRVLLKHSCGSAAEVRAAQKGFHSVLQHDL